MERRYADASAADFRRVLTPVSSLRKAAREQMALSFRRGKALTSAMVSSSAPRARFAEMSPIARFAGTFIQRYSDRVLYGTDMTYTRPVFRVSFRILETHDSRVSESA